MAGKKLLPCPFCGQPVSAVYPSITKLDDGTWSLMHFCRTYEADELEVCIQTYGKSEDEAIEHWNRRVMTDV